MDQACGQRCRAGRNLRNPAPNFPEEGAREQRGSALPQVTQLVCSETRTQGFGVQRRLRCILARLGWMGGTLGPATPGCRVRGGAGARERSLSEVPVTAARTLPRLSGDTCGGSGRKIRCLGSLRSQHLLRKFVFINVRGRAALAPYLQAPCFSRKAGWGGGGVRGAALGRELASLCGTGRESQGVSQQVGPDRSGLVDVRLRLPYFPGWGVVA